MLENIPRIYTAIAEWGSCLIFIIVSKKRYNTGITALLAVLFLGLQIALQLFAGTLPLDFWIPGMIMNVALMFLFIYTCDDLSFFSAGTKCAQAFIIAEFIASIEWQLYYYFYMNVSFVRNLFFEIFFVAVIYSVIFGLILFLELRYYKNKINIDIKWKDFVGTASIVIVIFAMSNISFVSVNTPFSARYTNEIFIIRTLVDLCGVILLYSQQEQKLWLNAKKELSAMENILNRQYEQYCHSKENIELLNRKYHDLKHQIAVIKAEPNLEKKTEYLEELDKGIKMFEAENKTGNMVLDIVLTGKSLQCVENNITFTCVADGKLINFMDVMDICSIFGNALDNAIESVKNITDPEKRLIRMAIFQKNSLLTIRIENYYENPLILENGNYLTTKKNKSEHGYGIKSIKAAVEKYKGNLIINTDNNWFKICIIIPIND
jgi:nitrogen fixation/metabolism regulation signal transduction histidine kinase